jgi:hypothetical protein
MTINLALARLAGAWHGQNRLWLTPTEPARISDTPATPALVAGGQCPTVHDTWADDAQPHRGVPYIGRTDSSVRITVAWCDSFHTGATLMIFEGAETPAGSLTVRGTYAAPPGPNWGRRIPLEPAKGDGLGVVLHNITPTGEELLAAEAGSTRLP